MNSSHAVHILTALAVQATIGLLTGDCCWRRCWFDVNLKENPCTKTCQPTHPFSPERLTA